MIIWRCDPESNWASWICNPEHNRFAIAPNTHIARNYLIANGFAIHCITILLSRRTGNVSETLNEYQNLKVKGKAEAFPE